MLLAPFLALAAVVLTGVPQISANDDDDDREYSRITAKRAIVENCRICHTDDLISAQRLTPSQWKAEVEKMVGWGSPLVNEDQPKVIAYLAEEYPATAPKKAAERITLEKAFSTERPEGGLEKHGDAVIGEVRFLKDCANCHGKNGQGAELGPNLVEKSVLYRPGDFHSVIKEGRGRMPGSKDLISPETSDDIAEWLRGRRFMPGS